MITKMRTKTLNLFFLSILFAIFSLSLVNAAVLAEWNFESQNLTPSTDITSGAVLTLNTGDNASFTSGNPPSANFSLSSSSWNVGDNFDIDLSTVGYRDIILKFDERASSTGPTSFIIQYSSDGSTFNNLSGSTLTSANFGTNPMHTFDFSSITSIDNNVNTKIRITTPTDANSSSGTWRIDNLRVEGSTIPPPSNDQDFLSNFCVFDKGEPNNPGDLDISIEDVTVTSGFGDDEEWYPFDEIEIEVKIENNGNDDVDNIAFEWGLYDTENDEWVIDVDEEDEFDINEDDDETVTFTITIDDDLDVDLEDLDDGDHYILFVRATGEIAEGDNEGDDTCEWDSQDIELIIERDFVVLSNFDIPESVSCGENLVINADAWNVGTRDQDDVSVSAVVRDFQYNKLVEISEIESFKNEDVEFSIPIPNNAQEKSYIINFEVYDEDRDIFENDNNDESKFTRTFKVAGCGAPPKDTGTKEKVLVSASLVSGGKAGEELVIKSIITNTGEDTATYVLNAAGFADWASSFDVSEDTITVSKDDSEEVTFTFKVKEGISSGDYLFNIEIVSNGNLVATQPVSVTIEGERARGIDLSGLFKGNWYLWLIGLLNVILVIIIIVVAVRVAKKR